MVKNRFVNLFYWDAGQEIEPVMHIYSTLQAEPTIAYRQVWSKHVLVANLWLPVHNSTS